MHLVQELAGVPANLFRLAGHVLTDDRQEARTGCGKFRIVDLEINFNPSNLNVFCMINRRQTRPLVAMT